MMMILTIVSIYVLSFCIMYVLWKKNKGAMSFCTLLMFGLVPVFGLIGFLGCRYIPESKTNNLASPILQEQEDEELIIKNNLKNVLPIEEVMIINTPQEQRKVVKGILGQDHLEDYVSALQSKALYNDVETTHYATVAIVETQNYYEKELRYLKSYCEEDMDDMERLNQYTQELKKYIESNILSGQVLKLYQEQYRCTLLKQYKHHVKDIEVLKELILINIAMQNFAEAEKWMNIMEKEWPNNQETYVLKIKFYTITRQSEKLQQSLNQLDQIQSPCSQTTKEISGLWGK